MNIVLGPQGILMISCNLNSSDTIIKTYLGRKSQEKTQKQKCQKLQMKFIFQGEKRISQLNEAVRQNKGGLTI